ncbi:hypothetical protein KY319_01190 [Candidatus Woesearchaeota archaeon]|nr:hypothetical protein [Candidatus Woesearchaeota archaeon]
MKKIICQTPVELGGQKYIVYLKEVPSRVGPGGEPQATYVKAFVKKAK